MATGPKIVHKQFNSPIGLYSQQNIQETLNKHLQNLDNGTVGIDFNNPVKDKPANLANSAVLRMLEEEERNRKGYPRQKKVVWPPTPETNGYHQTQQQSPAFYNNEQHSPSQQQYSPQQQQYSPQQQQYSPQPQQYSPQPKQQQPQYQPQYQTPSQDQYPSYQAPQSEPAYCEGRRQEATGLSKLIPAGPGITASPVSPPYRQGPLSPSAQPYRQQQSRWAPVPAPTSPQPTSQKPQYQSQYSGQSQGQYSPQPQYSEPLYQPPQKPFEPPATTITLRPQPPIHQKPSPVFASQPATASLKGGVNMRGDQKWPPQSVKEAVAAENEARMQLAKGPACRPRKVKKDYSSFFSQHALNHSYTSYRVPPGTQHFDTQYQSGRSSY